MNIWLKLIIILGILGLIVWCSLQNLETYLDQTSAYSKGILAATPPPSTYNTVYNGTLNSTTTQTVVDPSINNIAAKTNYDTNNYDIQYHDDPSSNTHTDIISPMNGTWVNQNGKAVYIPWAVQPKYVTYYTSGAYPYGASTYVPTYEESVYLSKTTGQSSVANAYPTATQLKGFCTKKAEPGAIEQQCGSLTPDQCASTMCCVLLGGSKCVGGDERGPTYPANYSDPLVIHKDVYYYHGRCYGNCDETNTSGTPYPRKPSDIQ